MNEATFDVYLSGTCHRVTRNGMIDLAKNHSADVIRSKQSFLVERVKLGTILLQAERLLGPGYDWFLDSIPLKRRPASQCVGLAEQWADSEGTLDRVRLFECLHAAKPGKYPSLAAFDETRVSIRQAKALLSKPRAVGDVRGMQETNTEDGGAEGNTEGTEEDDDGVDVDEDAGDGEGGEGGEAGDESYEPVTLEEMPPNDGVRRIYASSAPLQMQATLGGWAPALVTTAAAVLDREENGDPTNGVLATPVAATQLTFEDLRSELRVELQATLAQIDLLDAEDMRHVLNMLRSLPRAAVGGAGHQ